MRPSAASKSVLWQRLFASGSFSRSAMSVGGAAALSQLASIVAMPILARLYDQSAFGHAGALLAYANILAAILLFGLSDAALASDDDEDAVRLTLAGVVVPVLLAPGMIVLTDFFVDTNRFGLGGLPPYASGLATAVVLMLVILSHLQNQLVRVRNFSATAKGYLNLGVTRASMQLAGGAMGFGFAGLFGGELVAQALTNLGLVRAWTKSARRPTSASVGSILSTLARYRRFLLFRTPSSILSATAVGLPALLVIGQFGAVDAGHFNMTAMMLVAPVVLIQKAIGDVFIGQFIGLRREKADATTLIVRVGLTLTGIAAIGGLAIWLLAPWAFSTAFGAEWRASGEMAIACVPWFMAMIIVLPLSQVLIVNHRPDLKLGFDFSYIGLLFLADSIATDNHAGSLTYVEYISWGSALAYLLYVPLLIWSFLRPGSVASP